MCGEAQYAPVRAYDAGTTIVAYVKYYMCVGTANGTRFVWKRNGRGMTNRTFALAPLDPIRCSSLAFIIASTRDFYARVPRSLSEKNSTMFD